MFALSIRQPFAELILRGIKTVEYRSRPTRRVGERFWIYAAKRPAAEHHRWLPGAGELFDRINVAPPLWLADLSDAATMLDPNLPLGLIVGSAVIERCCPFVPAIDPLHAPTTLVENSTPLFQWHLTDVQRLPARENRKAGRSLSGFDLSEICRACSGRMSLHRLPQAGESDLSRTHGSHHAYHFECANPQPKTVARKLLGLSLVFAGVSHLTFARNDFHAQVPETVPKISGLSKDQIVVLSGIAEVTLGSAIALAGPKRQKLIGLIAAAFFIAVFPGNIAQYPQ